MKKSILLFILLVSPLLLWAENLTLFRAKKIQATPYNSYTPGQILVKDGIIVKIGKSIEYPKECKIVEWKDLEIYPGLISPGSSLGLAEINALRATRDLSEVGTHTPEVESWVAINPDSELIPVARANGVTHSLIIPMGGTISGTSGFVMLNGWGIEEMTLRKKVALHLWWPGHGLTFPQPHDKKDPTPKSIEEQIKERKKRILEIDEFFDQAKSYQKGKLSKDSNFRKMPSWEAMLPVINRQIPIMIHADEKRQIKAAIEWAKKRNFSIILSGAKDSWKLADLLAQEKVPVIYRHIFNRPNHRNSPHDQQFRAPSILAHAGVHLSIGLPLGGWSSANQRNLPYHAAHAVAYGLSREKALAAITIEPAKVCGIANHLGSLEKGKQATFIATSGDILDIRTSVLHMIMKGGKVSLDSRHTRLRSKYLSRPRK
jgi:imidazolonepropionase-like amidohydrolase